LLKRSAGKMLQSIREEAGGEGKETEMKEKQQAQP
jgi:hypothetical protein